MKTQLGGIALNQHKIDLTNLGISDWDTSTSGTQAMPDTSSAHSTSCVCTVAGSFILTSGTTSYTGVASFSAFGGQIKFADGTMTIKVSHQVSLILFIRAMLL
jgi:hypothetical protein